MNSVCSITPVRTGITYQLETCNSCLADPDLLKLFQEHYDEFEPSHQGRMELGPDIAGYKAVEAAGKLLILTARNGGKLIGYCVVVVHRHMHYPTLIGIEDAYYVSKSERKGLVGYKLLKKTLVELRARGCKKVFFMTKEFQSVAILLERLGMKKIDSVYTMWLE